MSNLNNVHLFNVATSGSSASTWLNNVLQAGGATSFHALRDDPFEQEVNIKARVDIPKLDELRLFHGLKMLGQRIGNSTGSPISIGVVHSFYRSTGALAAFKTLGGGCNIAMFRHPISRINSQFQAHFVNYKVAKVHNFSQYLNKHEENFFSALNEFSQKIDLAKTEAIDLLKTLANEIVLADVDNFENCKDDERLIFEDMFEDIEGTKRILSNLTQLDFSGVANSFFTTKTNEHILNTKNRVNNIAELPEFIADTLHKIIQQNPKSLDYYQQLNYVDFTGL